MIQNTSINALNGPWNALWMKDFQYMGEIKYGENIIKHSVLCCQWLDLNWSSNPIEGIEGEGIEVGAKKG